MSPSITDKTVILITGANQGIGLAVATQLARKEGQHVIIGSRNASAGAEAAKAIEQAKSSVSSIQLDLASDASVAAAVKTIEADFGRLDVLVNNAGILLDGKVADQAPRALFEQTFATNVIGTACLTEALLPLLRKSTLPRIVFVSSRMGSLFQATVRDTSFFATDFKAYDASKAAVNMLVLNYSRILEDVGGQVNAVCPGYVSTNMTAYTSYAMPPEVGAKRIVELATAGKGSPSATFSDNDGTIAW